MTYEHIDEIAYLAGVRSLEMCHKLVQLLICSFKCQKLREINKKNKCYFNPNLANNVRHRDLHFVDSGDRRIEIFAAHLLLLLFTMHIHAG